MFLENTGHKNESYGWIEVITGSMFSGKTEELIRRLKRAKFANLNVEIFKPEVDNCDVVGIDEAQFFDDEIVRVCNDLANLGIRVIVAGLDMDFKGNPFGPMPNLMATAEYVTKVHAICTRTGQLAHHSFRKGENDSLVMLGETEEYEPLSRAAFHKLMVREKVRKMNVTSETVTPKKSKNA